MEEAMAEGAAALAEEYNDLLDDYYTFGDTFAAKAIERMAYAAVERGELTVDAHGVFHPATPAKEKPA
jgi:hypothetical protein